MAKIKERLCKGCGGQIAPKGKVICPNCGTVNKKSVFKKWWFWVIIVIIIIAIIGGSSNNEPTKEINDSNKSSSSQPESTDDTFSLNETAVFNDLKITATEIKESTGEGFLEIEKGMVYVGVNFTIENISSDDQAMSSILLFNAYIDGVKCDLSIAGYGVFSEGTLDGNLSPGKKLVGWYTIETSLDWQELELQVQPTFLSSSDAVFIFNK